MGHPRGPDRLRRMLILLVVSTGTFLALLDVTIVNVALPSIMTSLGVNVKQVKWVSTAFLIATAVGMPLTGFLGRRFGLGRLFMAELIVFTGGSALCALAWNLEALVTARVIQALGAGAIMPTSMALITETFPQNERGRAMGVWGIGFMLGPAIGPTTGGFLTEWFDWRAIFAINLPLGLLVILLASMSIRPGEPNRSARFDWSGYLALAVFLVAGLLTLDNGQDEGWASTQILFGLGITGAAFVLFLTLTWDSPNPVLPLGLFRKGTFTASVLLGLVRSPVMFGAFFLLPIFLQNVQGRDTIDTGLLMVPTALAVAVGMWMAGVATDRFGPRWPTVFGFVCSAYSLYLFHDIDPLMGRWDVIYPQLWRGIGVAFIITPVNTAVMNAVGRSDAGTASWMINLTQSVGGAVTIAALGTLLHQHTIVQMDLLAASEALKGAPPAGMLHYAMQFGHSALESGRLASGLMLREVALSASTLAFQELYLLMAVLALLGVLPALWLAPFRFSLPGFRNWPVFRSLPGIGLLGGGSAGAFLRGLLRWPGVRLPLFGTRYAPPPPPHSAPPHSAPLRRSAAGASGGVQWNTSSWNRAVVLGVVMVGPFMALLEASVVNVALPRIMTTFGANIDQVKWVNTAFLLAAAVGLPVTGWLGRRLGLGRTFICEMAVFTFGSALSTFAWSLDMLIVSRIIQAIGAGSLMPTSMAIVTNLFPPHERGRAFGIWGIGFIAGPAIGPVVGGVLIEWVDWRAIFGINIPIGLAVMAVAAISLERGELKPGHSFDWRGYLALAVFMVAGLLTLEQGNETGWDAMPIQIGAGLAFTAFILFILFCRDGDNPILPLRVFRDPDFSLAIWLGVIRATALFSYLFMLPVFLQNVQGRDPIETGLLMMPAPLCVAVTMPIAGALTDRFGPRWLTFSGVLLVSYSLYQYSLLDPLSGVWAVIFPQLFRGVGLALINTPVNTTAMNAVRREDAPSASWIIALTRMLTASAVIALLGTLLPALQTVELERLGAAEILSQAPPPALVDQAIALGHTPADAGAVAQTFLLRNFSQAASTLAYQKLYFAFSLLVLTGLIPALLLSNIRNKPMEER